MKPAKKTRTKASPKPITGDKRQAAATSEDTETKVSVKTEPVSQAVTAPKPNAIVEDEFEGELIRPEPKPAQPILTLPLSSALIDKLKRSAQDEGVSVETLATELLAEGVVLRAWEIIERKNAMRGQSTGNQGQGGNFRPNHGNQRHGHNNKHGNRMGGSGNGNHQGNHGGNRRPPNNAWMEDKAAFLEYVRNQEKQRR